MRKIPNFRWWIIGLIALVTAINYLDRQNLPVALSEIRKTIPISDSQYGLINSLFLFAYGTMYAIVGRLLDRLGSRRGYAIMTIWWSLSNMLHGLVSSFTGLGVARFLFLTETTDVQTTATRAPVKDVYESIIKDLEFAVQTLPATASSYGRVTRPAAENLLATVYLARATSEAKQAGDYAKAAELAKGVISKYNFKLVDDFGKVFEQGAAEKNSEVIWSIQNNKDVISNGLGNTMHLYFVMKYDDLIGMQRDIANGRPYARYKPTNFVLNTLFNRQLDARYEKSFKRVFYCNKPGTYTISGKSVTLAAGDTAVYLPDQEWTAAEISRAKYSVYPPSRQNERIFPTLTKFLDPQRQGINDQPGSRDLLFFRLAETYLVAAEASMMSGNTAEAATLVNVVRRRATKVGTTAETEANRKSMEITPGDLTIDFILDERARELLGEGNRWLDLTRTGKLVERVRKYNPVAAPNIKDFHALRPIPQEQIDRTEGGFKQNTGY